MLSKSILVNFGVPYGSRTRVAAVKEKRPIVIQRNLAAWIAHSTALEGLTGTLIGRAVCHARDATLSVAVNGF
jgi:hypothetical protein